MSKAWMLHNPWWPSTKKKIQRFSCTRFCPLTVEVDDVLSALAAGPVGIKRQRYREVTGDVTDRVDINS